MDKKEVKKIESKARKIMGEAQPWTFHADGG